MAPLAITLATGPAQALEYPGGWQDVELYETVKEVPPGFIAAHQSPVGYRRGGCSGTLIGDGLYLTVAHCIFGGEQNNFVRLGYQLDRNNALREWERYDVDQVLEDNPDAAIHGGVDHGLLRLGGNPENQYGFATMEAREPDIANPLVVIGHPGIPTADPEDTGHTSFKTALVPDILCVGSDDIGPHEFTYARGVTVYGGSSGAGVWDPITGRLIGVNRASGSHCAAAGGRGMGNTILRHQRVSDFLDDDRGSARMYSFTGAGLTQFRWRQLNWRSSYHHIVPGNYRGLGTQEVLIYDSFHGEAQFHTVGTSRGAVALGPAHTGLNLPDQPWGQIVPIQFDPATPQHELLFLNTRSGAYQIYRTDGAGSLDLVAHSGNLALRGLDGSAPRLAVAGDFATRAGQELAVYFPFEGRLAVFGTSPDGTLTRLAGALAELPTSSIMIPAEVRTASARQEILLYHPETQEISMVWFANNGTPTRLGPVAVPGGLATQLAAGAFLDGAANFFAYTPSESNVYANVAEDTGTVRYYRIDDALGLTEVLVESGYRRSVSKFIVGDFRTDGVPDAIMYDRYRAS
ncbi:MAG TPA: trypsin-like peptidase domain-containing protein [Pilimelia sp.]|nr:trypsin-like peptidase domain-containing protein [Pilimelia sp.]